MRSRLSDYPDAQSRKVKGPLSLALLPPAPPGFGSASAHPVDRTLGAPMAMQYARIWQFMRVGVLEVVRWRYQGSQTVSQVLPGVSAAAAPGVGGGDSEEQSGCQTGVNWSSRHTRRGPYGASSQPDFSLAGGRLISTVPGVIRWHWGAGE